MKRALFLLPAAVLAASCFSSLGQGTGEVKSSHLFARDCWGSLDSTLVARGAAYDMQPDFFAAIPYRSTMQIRVQRGTDFTEVSDGLWVAIDDITKIRTRLASGHAATFKVALAPGVIPAGSPAQPPEDLIKDPAIVHMALYLQRSCHNQNLILYAVSGTISFSALFDGDPNETQGEEKLTDATFDVQMGDIRDTPFGQYAGDVPPGLQSRVTGSFRFYFERGQPAQPFP